MFANADNWIAEIKDAIKNNDLTKVRLLSQQPGINIYNLTPPYGLPPLGVAILEGKLEIAEYLLSNFDYREHFEDDDALTDFEDYLRSAISSAAESGYLDIIKFFGEHKNEDFKFLLDSACGEDFASSICKYTPLMVAAGNGHLPVVKYLVEEYGADVNIKEPYSGKSALSYAAKSGHLEVVKLLCKKDAHITTKDIDRAQDPEVKLFLKTEMEKREKLKQSVGLFHGHPSKAPGKKETTGHSEIVKRDSNKAKKHK